MLQNRSLQWCCGLSRVSPDGRGRGPQDGHGEPLTPMSRGRLGSVEKTGRDGQKTTRGIILAGSYNWGDSVFERLLPRPLLPVAQRPLISYGLQWLYEGGIGAVTVCANNGLKAVRARFAAEPPPGVCVDYYEDRLPRGPAGCLRDAALFCGADTFVVTDGTAIPVLPLDELLDTHRSSGAAVTVVVHDEEVRRNGASLTS